ncbi:PucR family transcriptional regulator [Streptomyces sp. NPDC089919]|uniref:PucR family transcriptional regulator n=1 Tax=Streptomyces sp. NPDC089919 TaxID=3155188 RepID=UPI00341E921E
MPKPSDPLEPPSAPASAEPVPSGAAGGRGSVGPAGAGAAGAGPGAPVGPGPESAPVALEALLADQGLGLRRAGGGAEVPVYGVHASEMADPSPYLLGGELLLTAGQELGPGAYEGYVERLVAAGVAALGFGVAPVHAEVPQDLVRACDRLGLALVEVPPGTPFSAVARTVWRLMAAARTRELRRVTEAQQALAAAATRPDPLPAVLARLAATLGGWAAVLPPPAAPEAAPPLHSAGPTPAAPAAAALAGLARRVAAGGAASAAETVAGTHLAVYALGTPGGAGGGPLLCTATPRRLPGDHTIAGVAAVLLTLLTGRRAGGGGEGAALLRLLLGGDPADALGGGSWTVVHARGSGDPAELAAALGTTLYAAEGPSVRLLTDHPTTPRPGWRLGLSAPVDLGPPRTPGPGTPAAPEPAGTSTASGPGAPPADLAVADAQAARALERAEAARAPLARHADAGLAGLVGAAEAGAYAAALLAPLPPALRATLRSWLAHHGSWDRTAAALGIHRNTVRQRIAKAAALLDRELDDPDTRMDLWFALGAAERTGRPRRPGGGRSRLERGFGYGVKPSWGGPGGDVTQPLRAPLDSPGDCPVT